MNNLKINLSNNWIQILILLLLFWFLFLREDFTEIPIDTTECERCTSFKFIKENNNNIESFKKQCIKLDGKYDNDNKLCLDYKAIVDSKYNCNCEIN
jgi:hypothetical protein